MNILRRVLSAVVGVLLAFGATQFATAERAEAFTFNDDSYLVHSSVDLNGCTWRFGGLSFDDRGGYCYEYDTADSTYFYKEDDKRAYKVELVSNSKLGAKLECHPSTNKIWVYDTLNDGDGIYWEVFGTNGTQFLQAPGSSAEVEYNTYPSSGSINSIKVWDDSAKTDLITNLAWSGGAICKF